MPTRMKPPHLDKEDVLKRNTKIDRRVVADHERLEHELLKLGVEIKPSYNLEPPLGRNRARPHNLNR